MLRPRWSIEHNSAMTAPLQQQQVIPLECGHWQQHHFFRIQRLILALDISDMADVGTYLIRHNAGTIAFGNVLGLHLELGQIL